MSGYFSFNFVHKDNHILVVIKSDSYFSKNEFRNYIENIIKEKAREPLDSIIFIISNAQFNVISTEEHRKLFEAVLTRDPKIINIIIFGFDEFGNFSKNIDEEKHILIKGDSEFIDTEELPEIIRTKGIETLFQKNDVVSLAPAGTQFIKPSGTPCNEFIRALLLQSGDAETYFLAYSLLHFWADKEVDYIYIDTMAISPSIYKLIQIKKFLNPELKIPRLMSFHSYSGIKNVPRGNIDKSLIFISASTSGEMVNKIIKKWQMSANSNRILTFLSFEDAPEKSKLLLKIQRELKKKNTARGIDLSDIQISGEYFSPVTKSPREVLLGDKHKPPYFDKVLKKIQGQGLFDICRVSSNNKERIIYINTDTLIQSSDFLDWLQSTLKANATAFISHIIYVNDPASRKIADICFEFYKKYLNEDCIGRIKVLSEDDLETLGTNKTNEEVRNILIVSATNTKGNSLLSISRDLRNFVSDESSRIFISGILLPNSIKSYEALKSNLLHGSPKVKNLLLYYSKIYFNMDKRLNAWKKERKILEDLTFDSFQQATSRREVLSKSSSGLGENCFWPNLFDEPLYLRQGFAFWNFDYGDSATAAEVYLTISAVLQTAREGDKLAQHDRLYSDEYQSAILSPECFSRFNDGIIQASILRAAKPRELDYSISYEASRHMRRILTKIIRSAHSKMGEAFPEFMISLAIGHLRLKNDDLEQIIQEINNLRTPDNLEPEKRQKFSDNLAFFEKLISTSQDIEISS